MGSTTSLHDRMRLEERLRTLVDPTGFLINLFDHAPVGFAVWNVDGSVVVTNRAFSALFGAEPPPEYRVQEDSLLRSLGLMPLIERAFAGETVQLPTIWFDPRQLTNVAMAEGKRVAIAVTLFPLRSSSGELLYIGATYKDETEPRMLAEQLQQSEQRLRLDVTARRDAEARSQAVMQAALDAIVVMDHAGAIVDFNPAAEKLFGYTRAEVIGRSLGDTLIPPHLRAGHTSGLARYLATTTPHVLGRRVELSGVHRDGREFPAEIAVLRIDTDGEPVFTGYIRDITERRRAEEAEILRRAKDAAESANVELEAFSYTVAHDLRAPLRAMSGFASVLREDYGDKLDSDAHAMINRITSAAKRMGDLIDGLLALSRISKHELSYGSVDLGRLARDAAAQHGCDDVVVHEGLRVRADPALMRSVMQNLVGNAIKFTSRASAPRIEVGVTTTEAGRTFFVRDNGAGFDMAYAAQLFQPFKRLHAPGEFEGTGIGLATVQRVIRRHGGKIWVDAAVGAGATFYFTL